MKVFNVFENIAVSSFPPFPIFEAQCAGFCRLPQTTRLRLTLGRCGPSVLEVVYSAACDPVSALEIFVNIFTNNLAS